GYLEMALASGAEQLECTTLELTDVVFTQALAFAGDASVTVQLVTTEESPGQLRFEIASRTPAPGGTPWTQHARGTVRVERAHAPIALALEALRTRLGAVTSAPTAYAAMATSGLEYGPAFRGLDELRRGQGEALGRVNLPSAAGSPAGYQVHPALLD